VGQNFPETIINYCKIRQDKGRFSSGSQCYGEYNSLIQLKSPTVSRPHRCATYVGNPGKYTEKSVWFAFKEICVLAIQAGSSLVSFRSVLPSIQPTGTCSGKNFPLNCCPNVPIFKLLQIQFEPNAGHTERKRKTFHFFNQ
jgi:hypothetical protein